MLTELGVGAAVALIILREVFSFMKEKKNGGNKTASALVNASWQDLKRDIKEHGCNIGRQVMVDERLSRIEKNTVQNLDTCQKMFEMHDHVDEDGVPVWHLRASLRQDIAKMREGIEELVRLAKDRCGDG